MLTTRRVDEFLARRLASIGPNPEKFMPLWSIVGEGSKMPRGRKEAFRLEYPLHLYLAPAIENPDRAKFIYQSVTFLDAQAREDFRKNGGWEKHPVIFERYFPMRSSLVKSDREGDFSVNFASSNTMLSMSIAGKGNCFVALERDDMSPTSPNCLTQFGGALDRSIESRAIERLENEVGFFLKEQGWVCYLSFSNSGGLRPKDDIRRRRRLEKAFDRAKAHYGSVFGLTSTKGIYFKHVPLEADPAWTPYEVPVNLYFSTQRREPSQRQTNCLATFVPTINGFSFNVARRIPDNLIGEPLEEGKNLLAVDIERNRRIRFLTDQEILYTIRPEGDATLSSDRADSRGGMISDLAQLNLERLAGTKAADHIIARLPGTDNTLVPHVWKRNTALDNEGRRKGGQYRLRLAT